MMRIKIDVRADSTLKHLREMEARSKNFRAVFMWAKRYLERANSANFAASGLPVGGWSPLDARYAAWKSVNFPGRPMMQQSGKLFNSLRNLDNPAMRINNTTAEFGTIVEYAKFHQYGTNRMDKRKIVYEPVRFTQEFGEKAMKHIIEGRF
jgi:phage gpG-like protein